MFTTTIWKVSPGILIIGGANSDHRLADKYDSQWTWNNFLAARALQQAENVRNQVQRLMERFDLDLVSTSDERKFWQNIQKALVCGYFMQVAHKEGEKNNYLTVKDNQVSL